MSDNAGSQQPVSNMPAQSVYTPNQSNPPEPQTASQVSPPSTKRKFPVKTAIFAGIALLVVVLVFVAIKLLGRKGISSSEITWWGLWEDAAVIQPIITEYEQKNPKVKIKYIKQSPQDYRERLTNALAKGVGPDIFRFHNSWVPMLKSDLSPVPAGVMNASDFAKAYYPVATSDLTYATGILGIPLEYDGLTLFINEDIFQKAGKSAPATWDELRSLAKQLTVKDDRGVITQAGVALGTTGNVDHWPEILALMMFQNGVDLASPTGKLAEDALTFYSLFSVVDGVWDATQPPSTAAFAAGKLAMYFAPSWRAFEIQQANPDLKFKTAPLPQLPKDNSNQPNIAYGSYWVEGVWARSDKKQAAWDFLKFLSEKTTLQKLYQNESKVRGFGEPYPRSDMANLLATQPIVGSLISDAPGAHSWYLQDATFDGPTGINSQINKYFEDAINSVNAGNPADKALQTVAQGVNQILKQYAVATK